jgi:hypothetical protein
MKECRKMENINFKRPVTIITYGIIAILIGYLRLAFPGKSLAENDAVLYTEIVKIIHGINPFPHFTFKWTPLFLSGYYGWIMPDLRIMLYFFLPFLKAQFYFTALFGIGVIFSTYRFAMRLYSERRIAILAAFLISIIPIQVSMSYGISSEIPQSFFLIESFNFLMDFINKQRWKFFFISGILLGFSILAKPVSMLLIPAVCLLIFINRRIIKGNVFKFMLLYFILPLLIWLSWAIPNFYRIFGSYAHSFVSFGFNVGSETMKIGLIESHKEFLAIGGIVLLLCSLFYLFWTHKKEDIFILFSVGSSLIILYSLKDVMTYWYPFIVPFYCIAISRAFLIKLKFIKAMFFALIIYFIGICIRTDILNLYFDFNSQSGYLMRPDTNWMEFSLVGCQANLDTIKRVKEVVKENDVVFLSGTFGSYKGFLMDIDTRYLPEYRIIKQGSIEYKEDWIKDIDKVIGDAIGTRKARVFIVLQDGAYYYRVYNKGVWLETHQDKILEENGFREIYGKEYPDKEAIEKGKRFYRYCSSASQWAKNYIFVKEYN